MPDDTETPSGNDVTETPSQSDADALVLALLKADLNRTGNFPSDNEYLSALISASRQWLERAGVPDDGGPMYQQILASRAAWIYRKRVTGEAEPQFLRRMIADYKISRAGKE